MADVAITQAAREANQIDFMWTVEPDRRATFGKRSIGLFGVDDVTFTA